MYVRPTLRFTIIVFTFLVSAWIFSSSSPAFMQEEDPAAKFPEGEGKGYVMTLCTSCHGLGNILSQRKSPEGWRATVATMLDRISPGMDQEVEIISKYLAANFGPAAVSNPGAASAHPPSAPGGPIKIGVSHQVLFNFKPEVGEEKRKEILQSGRVALESIPQVLNLVIGKVAQQDSEFQYGLFVGLKDNADLETYRNHPSHQKWLGDTFRPAVAKSVVTDIVE